MLLHDILDRSAARYPARTALRYQGRRLTYEDLRVLTLKTAAGLMQLNICRGDRVAVFLPNRAELVEVILACSRIGAICVLINPALKQRQIIHVVNDSSTCVLITDRVLSRHVAPVVRDCRSLRAVVVVDGNAEPLVTWQGINQSTLSELRSSTPLTPVRLIDQDVAALFYTSGSTGRAKGVAFTHRNLVSGAECVSKYLENTADDCLLALLPLSFDYGFSQVSTALYVGACAVLTTYFSPAVLIKTIEDEQITGLAGIPFIWSQLVATRWPSAPSPLRYITNSGGALNQAVIKALSELLPSTKIFCMYGLTEAFRSTYLDPANLFTRPGSIGMAVPNQEVFVLRPDGTPCGTDEIGELVHRGSFVTHGYWNDAAHTAQRFRRLPAAAAGPGHGSEICVWSGDLVRRDADGYIYFVGRADEQIKSSGVRISPTEVEEVIGEVEGVIETVVVGIPDSKLGQVVAALAIVGAERDHEALGERIREHCRLHLPRIMSPSVLQFVTDLPRTENGKPDRAAAKQLLSSTELCTPDCGAQRDSNGPIDD